jgi:hypothetical protein
MWSGQASFRFAPGTGVADMSSTIAAGEAARGEPWRRRCFVSSLTAVASSPAGAAAFASWQQRGYAKALRIVTLR